MNKQLEREEAQQLAQKETKRRRNAERVSLGKTISSDPSNDHRSHLVALASNKPTRNDKSDHSTRSHHPGTCTPTTGRREPE